MIFVLLAIATYVVGSTEGASTYPSHGEDGRSRRVAMMLGAPGKAVGARDRNFRGVCCVEIVKTYNGDYAPDRYSVKRTDTDECRREWTECYVDGEKKPEATSSACAKKLQRVLGLPVTDRIDEDLLGALKDEKTRLCR